MPTKIIVNCFYTMKIFLAWIWDTLYICFFTFKMNNMMTTLSGILEKLRLKKQDNEFQIAEDQFLAPSGKLYNAEELSIIKTYRFEGDSDPGDSSILYLIEANDGLIGYSIDAYGVYSNHEGNAYDEFIRKITVNERDEQEIFI